MVIGSAIGLLALVVLVLAVARGIVRRDSLLMTVADAIIALGVECEELAGRAWRRQTRGQSFWQARYAAPGVIVRLFDALSGRLFRTGWRIEERVLGRNHYNPYDYGDNFGLAAASPSSMDEYDDDDFYYGDDARYDG